MIYKGENVLTIPNILSAYRLTSFPLGIVLIVLGYERFYFWLVVFNQFTDILDGIIARRFHMKTRLGSRLDSLADLGTYILVMTGIVVFRWQYVLEYRVLCIVFVGVYFTRHIVSLVKFGRYIGLHVNSVRACSLLQFALFIVLFSCGPIAVLFHVTVILSVLAFGEAIAILIVLDNPATRVASLRQLLKDRIYETDPD
jgi:CDP-diacylglycerol--glycerol-3-phosphate 3-phosphatidyltransferase